LIKSRYILYVREIKFHKSIEKSIIDEVVNKIDRLKYPSNLSVRSLLIYSGQLEETITTAGFFAKIIGFDSLLKTEN